MDFEKHIPNEVLACYLRGELDGDERVTTRLHLSYCPSCQLRRDEVLFADDVYGPLVFGSISSVPSQHVADAVFTKFWDGAIRNQDEIEAIAKHCVVCRECRARREDVWRTRQTLHRRARFVALALTFAMATAAKMKRLRPVGIAVGVAIIAVAALTIGGLRFIRTPVANVPPIAINSLRASMGIDAPVSKPFPVEPTRTISSEHVWPKSERVRKPKRFAKPAADSTALWDRMAQSQRIKLDVSTQDESFRGADTTKENIERLHLPVVISRTKDTHVSIELPAGSEKGTYIVSVKDLADLDHSKASDKEDSVDGKEISVSWDLTHLPAGEYVLCLERIDGTPDDVEVIGHFLMFAIDPVSTSQ